MVVEHAGASRLFDEAHAKLCRSFVRWLRQKPSVQTFCEVPFSHWGDRGVVDVLALFRLSPETPWQGIACELKPAVLDLGGTIRQVRKAQAYFQPPSTLAHMGQMLLRFPLILEANEENFLTATHYAEILEGIEVRFFDVEKALDNPFERAWRLRPNQTAADPRAVWQPPMGMNSLIYEGRAHLA